MPALRGSSTPSHILTRTGLRPRVASLRAWLRVRDGVAERGWCGRVSLKGSQL